MKLRLSQQQDDSRPATLTLDFFSSLMATQSKRSGVFQILSFTRKRERVFSTKLNDGYFILKVMAANEAADQLEKGLIKPFYLLQGNIRNHGQGVIVVKEPLKFWEYGKEVGQPIPWRLKRQNVNYKGSNLVAWSTQKIENLYCNASQIMIDYGIQTSSGKMQSNKKHLNQFNSVEKRSIVQKMFTSEKKHHGQTQETAINSNVDQKDRCEETQSIGHAEEEQKVMTPKNEAKQNRFQSILELLVTDSADEEEEEELLLVPPTKPSQKKMSTNKKKMQQRKKDLQFIFDCLSDSGSQSQKLSNRTITIGKNSVQNIDNIIDDNDQDDILDWIEKKKAKQKQQSSQNNSKKLSNAKSEEALSKDKSVQIKNDQNESNGLIAFDNLYHGYVKKKAIWHCFAIVKCLRQENQFIHAIICDQSHLYLIFTTFINFQQMPFSLQENKTYKLGNGLIRQSLMHKANSSSFDIEFDCTNCILEQVNQTSQEPVQPSHNYTPIEKIYQMDEGVAVNCLGILKDFKSFKGKTGNTLHYQIIDPITHWSISYVQFQCRLNTQEVKDMVDKPISIYGAVTSSYKNKSNLIRKPFTIVKHNWLPFTKEAREITIWMKENSSVAHIETELVGYTEVAELKDVQDENGNNFIIRNVEIIEFKQKYTYRACVVCFKKVDENRCRTCGFRKQTQIEDRLFLRGEIGDFSSTVSVIWSNSLAESIMSKGFEMMKRQWLLKKISIWIDRSSNNTITVVKMKSQDYKRNIQCLLSVIEKATLRN